MNHTLTRSAWRALFPFILLLLWGCATQTIANGHASEIRGEIEIIAIKEQRWTNEIEANRLAQGDYVVTVRFILPLQYRGKIRNIGVVRLSDLRVQGVALRVGDIVEMRASIEMFTGFAMPDVFSNFHALKIKDSAPR